MQLSPVLPLRKICINTDIHLFFFLFTKQKWYPQLQYFIAGKSVSTLGQSLGQCVLVSCYIVAVLLKLGQLCSVVQASPGHIIRYGIQNILFKKLVPGRSKSNSLYASGNLQALESQLQAVLMIYLCIFANSVNRVSLQNLCIQNARSDQVRIVILNVKLHGSTNEGHLH